MKPALSCSLLSWQINWLPFSLENIFLLSCPFLLISFLDKTNVFPSTFPCRSCFLSLLLLLLLFSGLSASFFEGGVPLSKAVQLMSHPFWAEWNCYLLCLLCNITINLSQNGIYFFFLRTESYSWLSFNLQLPATPSSSSTLLLAHWFVTVVNFSVWFLAPKCSSMHYTLTACHFPDDMATIVSPIC